MYVGILYVQILDLMSRRYNKYANTNIYMSIIVYLIVATSPTTAVQKGEVQKSAKKTYFINEYDLGTTKTENELIAICIHSKRFLFVNMVSSLGFRINLVDEKR